VIVEEEKDWEDKEEENNTKKANEATLKWTCALWTDCKK
jgi:hypothetical protein